MEMSNFCIREWNASLYVEQNSASGSASPTSTFNSNKTIKEWKYGVLQLFLGKIVFSQCRNDSNEKVQKQTGYLFEFEFLFSKIELIKKSSSSLIFPAITITTTQNEKHWFSSLDNRDETLTFLKYFFYSTPKDIPIKSQREDVVFGGAHSTNKGRELLQSVVDSNKSLAVAGSMLIEQGQQLRSASVKMVEMNHDLGIASRFTRGLKSWLPRWRIPKSYEHESFHVFDKDDAVGICSFPALYQDVSPNSKGALLQCNVTMEKNGLSIMDDYQKLVQYFKWTEVSRVQVVSAWELCITQYLIGKPDIKRFIASIEVASLLKQIEKYRPGKTESISPEVMSVWSQLDKMMRGEHCHVKDTKPESEKRLNDAEEEDFYATYTSPKTKVNYIETPSNQEMADLSKELTSLKSLALDVQKVQDEQLKEIDELTTAVAKETDNLSKLNKKVNRML